MRGSRGRAIVAIGCAAVLAFGLSGCFVFSKMKWDPAILKAGKKTTAVVSMVSDTGVSKDRMVPFVLVGFSDTSGLSVTGKRVFDVRGDYGGPYDMFADGALRNAALQADGCAFAGATLDQADDMLWTALRTEGRVNDRDKVKPAAVAHVQVKVPESHPAGQAQVTLFTGNWTEGAMPNNVPEPDEIGCGGGSISSFNVRAG